MKSCHFLKREEYKIGGTYKGVNLFFSRGIGSYEAVTHYRSVSKSLILYGTSLKRVEQLKSRNTDSFPNSAQPLCN